MNNDTRKRIDIIIKDIETSATVAKEIRMLIEQINEKIADYKETFVDARTMIEEIREEEQEKFDNLSEGLQASERGQNLEAAVNALDEALNAIDPIDEYEEISFDFDTDEIIQQLDEAKGY